LKNVTRPCKDATAAHILIKSGIFSLILQYVTISGGLFPGARKLDRANNSGSQSSSSVNTTTADPLDDFTNAPSSWDSNSMQDAALFTILNLAACSTSRDYVYEADALNILSAITEFPSLKFDEKYELTHDQKCHQEFQCLKAVSSPWRVSCHRLPSFLSKLFLLTIESQRMALSYLVGSGGHFGQSKITSSASTVDGNPNTSVLIMSEAEIELLLELLSNTMQQRGKDGPGGYSAATFNLKYVLFAVRCLLTHTLNQALAATVVGLKLNTLLMKILAQYSIQRANMMDAEAAEYAAFTLYLQSNYGFQSPFLPALFTYPDAEGSLAAKVFTSYMHVPTITPAGRHAADQILLRLKFLIFDGELADIVGHEGSIPTVSDLEFGRDLQAKAEMFRVGKWSDGEEPRDNIFDRQILRSRKPKKGTADARAPWDNSAAVSIFPSALQAVQQLSYGSLKVRHLDSIDDIAIANNIANSANGERTESYNFWWSWEDKASEIQRNLEPHSSSEKKTTSFIDGVSNRLSRSTNNEPIAIFGLRCGPFFSSDTTA
jgi:hypothetical protein